MALRCPCICLFCPQNLLYCCIRFGSVINVELKVIWLDFFVLSCSVWYPDRPFWCIASEHDAPWTFFFAIFDFLSFSCYCCHFPVFYQDRKSTSQTLFMCHLNLFNQWLGLYLSCLLWFIRKSRGYVVFQCSLFRLAWFVLWIHVKWKISCLLHHVVFYDESQNKIGFPILMLDNWNMKICRLKVGLAHW